MQERVVGLKIGLVKTDQEVETWKLQKARQEGGIAENEYWLSKLKGAFY